MMHLLIMLGVDPHARTRPTTFFVPADLRNLEVTPGDIARLRGPDVLSAYLASLKTAGYGVHSVEDEIDGADEEIIWPAVEQV